MDRFLDSFKIFLLHLSLSLFLFLSLSLSLSLLNFLDL
jgi:hypothetical protein